MVILQKKVPELSEKSLARFVLRARRAARLAGRVNLLVTGSAVMRSLNRKFRGQNKATDVLSFPSADAGSAGEIAISADIAAQNAFRLGHSPAQEIKILALHGILHLAGFDHERDNGAMARTEARLRRTLDLPNSLTERAQVEGKKASMARRRTRRTRRRTA